MDLTLWLTEAETKALQTLADSEARPVHDVARDAIHSYIEQYDHRRRVVASSTEVVERYAEALRRLGS